MIFFKATGVFAQKSSDPETLHGGKQSGSLFSAVSWLHGVPTGKENVELGPAEPTHTTCRLVQMFPEVPSIEKTRIDLETHLLKIEKKINKREKSSLQENANGKMEGIVKLDYRHSVTVTGITHPVRIPTFSNVGLQAPPHGH